MKIQSALAPVFGFAAAVLMIASAQAVVLAQYNFTHTGGGSNIPNPLSSDPQPNSVAGSFGTAGHAAGEGGISGSTDMAFLRTSELTTTTEGAVTAGDYFTFTFTPDPGATFNLTSITFKFGGSNSGSTSTTFNTTLALRSDAEAVDYSTNLATPFTQNITANTTDNQLSATQTISLTAAPEFQNVSGPVTFRFYVSSDDVSNRLKIARIDEVVLNGTVLTIPEPATSALIAAGVAALGLRRRRR